MDKTTRRHHRPRGGDAARQYRRGILDLPHPGQVRHRADHALRLDGLRHADRGGGQGLRRAQVRRQEGRPQARPLPQVRARVRGDGGRRRRARPRQRGWDPLRGPGGLGHRRPRHAAGLSQDAPRQGAGPRLAVLHPHAHHQHGVRPHLHALRRARPELLRGHRLRDGESRHRGRHPHHSTGRRRRDDRGGRRGHHHPPHHRGLLPDEGDVDAERRAHQAPLGPSTPSATASWPGRAVAWWCWSRSSTLGAATRGSMPRWSATA